MIRFDKRTALHWFWLGIMLLAIMPSALLADSSLIYQKQVLSQTQNDSLALSKELDKKAANFERQHEIDSAIKYYDWAYQIKRKILVGEDTALAHALSKVGHVFGLSGNYDQESDYLEQAADLFTKVLGSEHPQVATIYNNLAVSFKNRGDSEKQRLFLEKSLAIRHAYYGQSHPTIAESYHNLSTYFFGQRQMEQFFEFADKSLKMNLEHFGNDHIKIASNYHNLAAGYERNRNYEKAISYYEKSLQIKQSNDADHSSIANTYNSMGNCYGKWGNKAKQGELLELALKVRIAALGKRDVKVAFSHSNLGKFFYLQGQFQKALEQFQKGLVAVSTEFDGTDISSNPIYETAMAKLQFFDLLRSKGKALENLYAKSKNFETLNNAYITFKAAAMAADRIRSNFDSESPQEQITAQAIGVYEGMISAALELHTFKKDDKFLAEALEYSERSKVYTLRQVVFKSQARQFANVPDDLVLEEINIKKELRSLDDRYNKALSSRDSVEIIQLSDLLFDKNVAYDRLLELLETDYPKYYQLKFDQKVSSLEEIRQDLLADGSVLVEFFEGRNHFYRFIITETDLFLDKILKPKGFQQTLSVFRKSTTDNRYVLSQPKEAKADYLASGLELYNLLLAEGLQKVGSEISKLIIVPDGVLGQINFEAFLTNQAEDVDVLDYRNLPYLVKRYTISYAYSATLLAEAKPTTKNIKIEFGGFAPIYNSNRASLDSVSHKMMSVLIRDAKLSLPGAEEEVVQINELLNGDLWVGEKATEANFKANAHEYRIIHLAMHGLLDDKNPLNSELVFAKSEESNEDDYLSIPEIYNLNLHSDLVVLSACNTGFGLFQKGEGNISMARAFTYAGSASVIMSLWKVPDFNTQKIMVTLYKNLTNSMRKGESLREAKIKYIEEIEDPLHAHPYYWAGFVLTGDGGQISSNTSSSIYWFAGLVLLLVLMAYNRKSKKAGRVGG